MAGKFSNAGAANVASGELEIAVLPVSEILSVPGVDFVGTIPAEIQFVQVFAAALVDCAKEPEASSLTIAQPPTAPLGTSIQAEAVTRERHEEKVAPNMP